VDLIASIKAAHATLTNNGYLGEAQIDVWANPGAAEVYVERGAVPFLRYHGRHLESGHLWRQIVPKPPKDQVSRGGTASASSNFSTRTEGCSALVADLLNQILRDFGYGADLAQLREHAKAVAD
jgi:hypothetical protein